MISPHPLNLVTQPWKAYAILDSGDGLKLESYDGVHVVRPEPQCLWSRKYPTLWDRIDAEFAPDHDEDEGRWRFENRPAEPWILSWDTVRFHGRFTAFRHLGFFPEQAANWAWQKKACLVRPGAKILNLFGYTGVASLVCAAAGAHVTHIDASKKAIGWARENALASDMEQAPIRWICEDARKYVAREIRRGTKYDGIILDPPKYGRGPDGEIWRLFEDLPALMADCASLLSDNPLFFLVNAYAARISGPALAHMMAALLPQDLDGALDYGELTLAETEMSPKGLTPSRLASREVGLSFYARYLAAGAGA